ncbi:uncharacterized protein LOC133450565 [Cololabis saira]|uniref:uncharacterized protein LOC133450565 n=1 Tax=Cololabis saira TaxID=129043 RepID=UPI002AD3E586|nr:uncharacterized protein LOC133450565 [Cololabis saira]
MDTSPPITPERAGEGAGNLPAVVPSTGHEVSNNDPLETDPTSLGDCKMDASTEQTTDPAATPTQVSTEAEICSQGESSVQSADHRPPELAGSSKTSRKAPPSRQGRLIKPRPNLKSSRRRPQPEQADDAAAAGADSCSRSQDVEASLDHKAEAELAPESTEDVSNEPSHNNSISAQSSLDSAPQVVPAENPSTSREEGIQNFPLLFDMLGNDLPSDPHEPFFVLSLTEVPVAPAGEMVAGAEPSPYPPVADPPAQQPSVSDTGLTAAGGGSTSKASSSSMSTTDTRGGADLTELAVASGDLCFQGDPQESTTETVGANEPETPPSKPKRSGRRANVPVRPRSTRRKQTSPAASDVEPAAAQTSGEAEQTAEEAPSQRNQRACRKRKAKDFPSSASETNNPSESSRPPGKAASKRAKVKPLVADGAVASTSRAAEPAASSPQPELALPTTSAAQLEEASDQTPGRSGPTSDAAWCPAEASKSQEGDVADSSSVEGEPTQVSQYFFSDIFTEVDEG